MYLENTKPGISTPLYFSLLFFSHPTSARPPGSSSVGLVQQEPALFGVSLRDNIALGCERRPSDAEIESAAKAANAYDFIARMPQVRRAIG